MMMVLKCPRYILSSLAIDRLIDNVAILDDYICSDHKPISFSVKCDVAKKLIDSDVGMWVWAYCLAGISVIMCHLPAT